jgi:hypothetical protein
MAMNIPNNSLKPFRTMLAIPQISEGEGIGSWAGKDSI